MTMRITMREPARSEDGASMLLKGSTYTVTVPFGRQLVQQGFAVDADASAGSAARQSAAVLPGAEIARPQHRRMMLAGIRAARALQSSNCVVTDVQRRAPDGALLNGIRIQANAGTSCSVDLPIPEGTYTGGNISALIYADPTSNGGLNPTMTWFVSDTLGYTVYYGASNAVFKEGWRNYAPGPVTSTFPWKWGSTGGAAWGTTVFANTRFRLNYSSGQTPWIELYEVTFDDAVQSCVCLTFDDGYDSAYLLGAQMLDQYGMKGTFAVQADTIGTAGRMTLAQLHDLVDRGHEIVPHGPTGGGGGNLRDNYSAFVDRDARVAADVQFHRNYLIANGLAVRGSENVYVYPEGVDEWAVGNDGIRNIMRRLGFVGARVTGDAICSKRSIHGQESFYISTNGHGFGSEGAEAANIAAIIARIDDAAAMKADAVVMFHQVTSGTPTTSLQIQQSNLELILKAIDANRAAGTQQNVPFSALCYATAGLVRPA